MTDTYVKYSLNADGKIELGVTRPTEGTMTEEEILNEFVTLDDIVRQAKARIFVERNKDEIHVEEDSPAEEEETTTTSRKKKKKKVRRRTEEIPAEEDEEEETPKISRKKKKKKKSKGAVQMASKKEVDELLTEANIVCRNFWINEKTEELGDEDAANAAYDELSEKEWEKYERAFLKKMGITDTDEISFKTYETVLEQLRANPYHDDNIESIEEEGDEEVDESEDDEYEYEDEE